jgi:hypothetical protein
MDYFPLELIPQYQGDVLIFADREIIPAGDQQRAVFETWRLIREIDGQQITLAQRRVQVGGFSWNGMYMENGAKPWDYTKAAQYRIPSPPNPPPEFDNFQTSWAAWRTFPFPAGATTFGLEQGLDRANLDTALALFEGLPFIPEFPDLPPRPLT